MGFSLDEIAELLLLDDGTHCEEASRLAEHKLQDVREKMADLARMEAVLSELVCACQVRVLAAEAERTSSASVVLAERPWDVVLLAEAGIKDAVYVAALDPAEYRQRLSLQLQRVQRAIWPIRQDDITVEFLRCLTEGFGRSVRQLRFAILPPGLRLP